MIKIERTDKVYDTISEVFKKDTKLYMLYHYESPTNHAEATEYNAMHNTVYAPKETVFYSVSYFGRIIGFVSILNECIWDFHISFQYRCQDSLDAMWDKVKGIMPSNFYIRLYERNYRDINWLITEKGAVPYKFDRTPVGYYKAILDLPVQGEKEYTYDRELSQILLKFEKE